MKKKLGLVVLCMILLAGCSSQNAEDAAVTLTLACWVEDFELQRLVTMFNESHEDAQIQVVEYYDDTMDIDAAIHQMQASIISGDLPDLYYLDSMDVMALRNAELLADLYPIMEADEDFQKADYYENIWSAFEADGKLYELAPGFQLGCLIGPKSVVGERTGWTIDAYKTFENSLNGDYGGIFAGRMDFLIYMIQFAMQDYINVEAGECSFDSDSFAEWLEFIGGFPESTDETLRYTLYSSWVMGLPEYLQYRNQLEDTPVMIGYPNDSAAGVCAMSLGSYGISSATEQQKLCWEFIKQTLSEEYQSQYIAATSFPIKRSVFQEKLNEAMLPVSDPSSPLYGDTTSSGQPAQPLSQEEATYLSNLLETVNRSRFRYDAVRMIITEEAEAYFSGDKTIEQVTELIQNRVTTYLEEKS